MRPRPITCAGSSAYAAHGVVTCGRARWSTWACRSPGRSRASCCRPGARRFVDGGVPVHVVPAHGRRHGAGLRGRVSFTGELGYEIWVTTIISARCTIAARGREHRPEANSAAARLNAMRIEKSFGTWAREYRPIYGPYEAGSGRFVDLKKGDFIGRSGGARGEARSGGKLRSWPSRSMRPMPMPSAMSRSGTTARWSAG
jgi:hypothetical protein